ncbi:VPLPA-CTERM sorting domain-containing protein [Roseovarius sp. S1116L3]|uniref:VPLPA-CTERM sorting domain-containing protein n=1 Tax=Roseovarius roseus TaxID=3342636 RepID=UPI0037269F9C
MSFVGNILGRTGAAALAVAGVFAVAPMANAAAIHATSAEVIKDGPRGTADGRDDISNAFGEADGAFFELGYDAVVEFQFGTPTGQAFFASGALIEVTFNENPNWKEAVLIEVGRKGIADSFVAANPTPFINSETFDDPTFTADGVFDTVRLTDLTRTLFSGSANDGVSGSGNPIAGLGGGSSFTAGGAGSSDQSAGLPSATGPTGGFDVDAITVMPVPLPAAGFLLIGALGGLAALRRRRKPA